MKPIIKVENLGKQYYLDTRESIVPTLREAFSLKTTLKRFSRRKVLADQVVWALNDVGFEVYPGEVVGIIGRNGAGKSTLLKILSRITRPTKGMADLYGRIGSLLEVGTGFHPDLTGRENIYFNGAILGMKREEVNRKFDEIVAFAQVERFLDTPVKRYSSGMYLRLAFAVAAHLEPEILLLDEVLTVGDALFQKKCLGKMEEVGRQGRTVLFVSHSMDSVRQLCGRVLFIRSGVLHEDGKPETVVASYLKDISNAEDNRLAL
jgi:lipopolysaccharide transport system ATP-binding protein